MKQLSDIPALKHTPLLGNISRFRKDRLALFQDLADSCGDIGIFHVGRIPVILVNSPDYIHDVLVTHNNVMEKVPLIKQYLNPFIGNGLLNASNDIHPRHRRLIAPAFHRHETLSQSSQIVSLTQQFTAKWRDGDVIDITQAMTQITLGVVGQALFSVDLTTDTDEMGASFVAAARHVAEQTTALFPIPLTWPSPGNRRFRRAIATLDRIIHTMIQTRRAQKSEKHDALAILLGSTFDDGQGMTDRQIRDEIMTFLFAGHETTANALSWMWLLLMENPTIYERLQAEVHQATAQALPNINSLNQLGYVLQVFKEVLRLYPSAYIIARQTTRAITLGDFYVPAGTAVGISPYVVHRRACYYAQPNVFDPERFVLATEQQRNRYTYLPFGAGPHACIGAGFALMEAQLIIATLTTLFSFERADSGTVTPEPLITLRPNNPIMLRVHRKRHLVDCSAPESTLAQG